MAIYLATTRKMYFFNLFSIYIDILGFPFIPDDMQSNIYGPHTTILNISGGKEIEEDIKETWGRHRGDTPPLYWVVAKN